MKRKELWNKAYLWAWCIVVTLCLFEVFFIVCPLLLPLILRYSYDPDLLEQLGLVGDSFGIYNALFSLLALGGVVLTLIFQYKDQKRQSVIDQYFRMLDTHTSILSSIAVLPVKIDRTYDKKTVVSQEKCEGNRAFIEYKCQLSKLLTLVKSIVSDKELHLDESDIADVAYICFYYGVDRLWIDTLYKVLDGYEDSNILVDEIVNRVVKEKNYRLGRTNQNVLSMYFRNMYNAIKLIDESCLTEEEKVKYVKILRAQLSNAELYVLFFNILSRYGAKWVIRDYVQKYGLLQNMPVNYCDSYEPRIYFPNTEYEYDMLKKSPFSK